MGSSVEVQCPGRTKPEAVDRLTSGEAEKNEKRADCEASLYAAEKASVQCRFETAQALLRQTSVACAPSFAQGTLARAELLRTGTQIR